MTDDSNQPTTPRQRESIIRSLDKMVTKGQMTEGEATRIREADGTQAFEAAVREVRVRHAGKRFEAAVADGSMTQNEADDILGQIRNGAHTRELRSHLRRLVPGKRTGG